MNTQWKFGLARADITPSEPIAMSGWWGHRISEGVVHPLWAKAVALQPANGAMAVLATLDLLGLTRRMSQELSQRAAQKFGLRREQLIINSSHIHAGPVAGESLPEAYDLSPVEQETVARYTAKLLDQIEWCIGQALASLGPCTLSFEQGLCGFGVNRRRDQLNGPDVASARSLPQVVDHDVPVLAIRGRDEEVRAVVFGYACHPTSHAVPQLCGDWPGYAQIEIESQFPGATALFVSGCGGDINPLPRFGRFGEELPAMFGKTLGASVCNVLDGEMRLLEGTLQTAFIEVELPLETPPKTSPVKSWTEKGNVPFPIHAWRIGDLNFIALSGEPVVDYALQFKNSYGTEQTWVAGYCSDVTAYIPTRRVLCEGGYEGKDGMTVYGWPAPFREDIEEVLLAAVESLMQKQG